MSFSPRNRARRRCRPIATALALAFLVGVPTHAARSVGDPALEVERLLAAPLEGERELGDLARDLAAIGPGAVEPLLEALAGTTRVDGPLRGARREAAIEALVALPRARVLSSLSRATRGEPTVAQRLVALEILARVAEAPQIGMLLRLGAPEPGAEGFQSAVQRAFEGAVAGLLQRHPEALEAFAAQMREAHPSLLVALVRQMGRCQSPHRLEVLAGQLGRVRGADVLLLIEIESVARSAPRAAVRKARRAVRDRLDSPDPLVVLAACRAVEALEDSEAVGALIGLVAQGEPAVQSAALATLESRTRRSFGLDAAAWNAWYLEQFTWWQGDAQRHLSVLRLGTRRELAPALMGLAGGQLFREEIVPVVTPLLRHADPDVARLTASVLANLGARAALPALAEALSHSDPAVAAGAHKALRRIVGRDLGRRPDPWLELAL